MLYFIVCVLGIGVGSFLCWCYFYIMLNGTEQALAEKQPRSQQGEPESHARFSAFGH